MSAMIFPIWRHCGASLIGSGHKYVRHGQHTAYLLIDYLRGRQAAVAYLGSLPLPLNVSVITVAELYAGVREGAERTQLDTFVRALSILPIDRDVAVMGGLYRRDFGRTHGTGLADALIAATATIHHLTLATLTQRHFPMLAQLVAPY